MSTMFRFTSLTLRPVFELQKALNGTRNIVIPYTPLRLVKVGPTVCLRVDDAYHHDGQIVRQASAEAEQNAGEPNTDDFAQSFFFHHTIYGQVLDDLCDLIITLDGTSQHIETRRCEKVWVPVATLRQETERVFNLAHQHFCACCQQRVKSDPLTVTTNGLILIHLVYSGLASAITPALRFCFSL
ncbi:hypothetical protein [Dickeya dianthicola]|uniref:hypothetical protein n=2 Tax=Dickeya dianthicola TaxID=204039 RepID=UPI00126887B3|nr:hypothetical protein [Dickeya dianthicola]